MGQRDRSFVKSQHVVWVQSGTTVEIIHVKSHDLAMLHQKALDEFYELHPELSRENGATFKLLYSTASEIKAEMCKEGYIRGLNGETNYTEKILAEHGHVARKEVEA